MYILRGGCLLLFFRSSNPHHARIFPYPPYRILPTIACAVYWIRHAVPHTAHYGCCFKIHGISVSLPLSLFPAAAPPHTSHYFRTSPFLCAIGYGVSSPPLPASTLPVWWRPNVSSSAGAKTSFQTHHGPSSSCAIGHCSIVPYTSRRKRNLGPQYWPQK